MNRYARLGLFSALLTLVYLGTFNGKSGCSKDDISKLTSPVQAIATVYRHADGLVDADLTLISTARNPAVFVNDGLDTRLRVIKGSGDVNTVPLDRTSDGHYTASSDLQAALLWELSATYAFDFALEADPDGTGVSGGTYSAQVKAPASEVTVTVAEAPAAPNLVAKLSIAGAYGRGLLHVWGPDGQLTYANWDLTTPDFDGSKWNSLIVGASHTVPASAFPTSGEYRLEFGACAFVQGLAAEVSATLGVLSGFLACNGTELSLTVP
jgi:hypothetical protein